MTTLAALIPDKMNADIRIIDEGVEQVDYQQLDADLVGITCITGTSTRAYMIADILREKKIKVVLGGPHPTLMPEEAKSHADAVVIGLANRSWPRLLEDFNRGRMEEFYEDPGVGAADIPIPRRDLLKKSNYITTATVQATYGCKNRCGFCVIHKTRPFFLKRPVDEVINEIKMLDNKLVLFLDPSPQEDKEYIKEFYRNLIKLKIKWMGLATTKFADDDELFGLMVQSGCVGLLIGFESVSEKSLGDMHKGFNRVDKYRKLISDLHKNKIAIMGCFTFGTDSEDKSIFKETVDFINDTGIDLPRFTVMTPFPNTDLYYKLKSEDRILSEDWQKYNAQNVVFKPKNMSAEELQAGLEYAWTETYKTKNIYKRLSRSRTRLLITLISNIGYKRYSKEMPIYR